MKKGQAKSDSFQITRQASYDQQLYSAVDSLASTRSAAHDCAGRPRKGSL